MKRIWKYEIDTASTQLVLMPVSSKILFVAYQGYQLCLWAEVDTSLPDEQRRIMIYATGEEYPSIAQEYIGTVQKDGIVWHVFEVL